MGRDSGPLFPEKQQRSGGLLPPRGDGGHVLPNMTNSRIVEHGEGDVILTHEAVWGEAAVDEGYIEGQTADAERNTYQYVVRFGFMLDLFVQLAGCLFWKARMRRCTGYNGLRVGKAKHPGPEGEGGQLAVLISLIQLLIQMVSKLTGGDADMARLMAKAIPLWVLWLLRGQTLRRIAQCSR